MKAIWALIPLIRHQRGSVVLMAFLHVLSAVLSLFTFVRRAILAHFVQVYFFRQRCKWDVGFIQSLL